MFHMMADDDLMSMWLRVKSCMGSEICVVAERGRSLNFRG